MPQGNDIFEYYSISSNVVAMIPSTPIKEIIEVTESVPTTCFSLPNGLVFVDCGAFPHLIEQFRRDMEQKFQKTTTHLLITHTHWDHIISMEVFRDIDVICSDLGIQGIENIINKVKKKTPDECQVAFDVGPKLGEILAKTKFFIPNIVVKDDYKLESDGIELLYKKVGGHSPDSAYVYFPSEKILCVGDNLLECYAQLPGNPDETLRIYNELKSLDIEVIVPGHGSFANPAYFEQVMNYFENIIAFLEKAIAEKITIKNVLQHSDLPAYFGDEIAISMVSLLKEGEN